MKTWLLRSILLLFLVSLPSYLFACFIISQSEPSFLKYLLISSVILLPIVVSIASAWKAKYKFNQGDKPNAVFYAQRARKLFYISLACSLIILIYNFVFPPVSIHYNAKARVALQNIIAAQNAYRESSGTYTDDLNKLNYESKDDVILKVNFADKLMWQGTSQHKKSGIVFIWDSREQVIKKASGNKKY